MIKEADYKQNKKETLNLLTEYYHKKNGIVPNQSEVGSQADENEANYEFTKEISLIYDDESNIVGRLIGLIDWTTYSFRIEDLYVDANQRGMGIGAKLVAEAEEIAMKNGCHTAFVDTTVSNSHKFYEKLGYLLIGELKDYPAQGEIYYFYYKRLR